MNAILRKSQVFFKRNSSTILTVVGGAGVITTTVLAIKATPKAVTLLEEAKKEKGTELTKLEKAKVVTPIYIPTMISGVTTLACIFGANILNKRQQAALMSAYALLDNSYKEYKNKVKEIYGEEGNDKVVAEIVKDKYEESEEIETNGDEILFYDNFSDQFFLSTRVRVSQAEYNLNRNISMDGYASLNEFYEYLDIEPVDGGEELGWSDGGNLTRYWQSWIDFEHKTVLMEDNETECIVINMQQEPYMEYEGY
jgi:hypothetical protein